PDAQPGAVLEHLGERLALDVLHGEVIGAALLPELEDLDDVRMRELRREAGLVEEHVDEVLVLRERREDALDDEPLLEAGWSRLAREEDLGHPADGDELLELVLAERLAHRSQLPVGTRGGRSPGLSAAPTPCSFRIVGGADPGCQSTGASGEAPVDRAR